MEVSEEEEILVGVDDHTVVVEEVLEMIVAEDSLADRDPGYAGQRDDRGGSGGPHFPTTRLMGDDSKKDFGR